MWLYKDKVFDSISENGNYIGFIYKIECNITGKVYYGKKNFFSKTTKQIKGLGKRPKKVVVIKESDWKKYYSSNKEIKELSKLNKNRFKRTILCLCKTAKELSYRELEVQVLNKVLEDDNCWNENILGRFFKRDLIHKT